MRSRRRKYRYRVIPLGIEFVNIATNVELQRELGWRLVSTYWDVNRNTVGREPTLCGIFETWEKVAR